MTAATREPLCRLPHKGKPPLATSGLVCEHHQADLRDVLADVEELLDAYANGDFISPDRGERVTGKNPHAPIPINLNRFLIGNPGGDPVGVLPKRNAHPADPSRIESNGPDAPDIPRLIHRWADAVAGKMATDSRPSDTREALTFLRRRVLVLAELDQVAEAFADLVACRRALAAALGVAVGMKPLCSCPYCNADLFTDRDREVIKLRRKGEPVPENPPGRLDLVRCFNCRIDWDGWPHLRRLKLIAEREARERRERSA